MRWKAAGAVASAVVAAVTLATATATAGADSATTVAVSSARLHVAGRQEQVTIVVRNRGRRELWLSRRGFELAALGDLFGARAWSARGETLAVQTGRSVRVRLSFAAPSPAAGAALFYNLGGGDSITVPLAASRPDSHRTSLASGAPTINTFWVTQGVGEPWGTAIDAAGDVWFADPGCDFAPTCSASTPAGEIGEIKASSHALAFYRLPAITGNQPIFLAFDPAGKLWFTTPNNSEIGEFDPATGKFIGQWHVAPGSGPWDLVISGTTLWYTEHLGAAIGSFNLSTHRYRDYRTPSANSNPYGLALATGRVWFTENNSAVDRVGALNTSNGTIAEYPIVLPVSGTPHMMTIGPGGHPWWTEGWSNTIATLDPTKAIPGSCGVPSGVCKGVQRYALPPASACSTSSHVSGITYNPSANLLWLDNSLTAQVGSFSASSGAFAMNTLSNCNAHPHDGMSLDAGGNVWFDEEFGNAIGELIP